MRLLWCRSSTPYEIAIIGSGGVTTWEDAVEYILAGASAVEIGVAVISEGTEVYKNVVNGLNEYLRVNGFSSVKDIVGLAHEEENNGGVSYE